MNWLFENPLYVIGVILSFVAAFGFLIFLRGFLLGMNQIFFIDANDEFADRARIRTVWGVLLMGQAFVFWVFVEWIASLFGKAEVNLELTQFILVLYAIFFAIPFVFRLAFPKKK